MSVKGPNSLQSPGACDIPGRLVSLLDHNPFVVRDVLKDNISNYKKRKRCKHVLVVYVKDTPGRFNISKPKTF